MKHYKEQLTVTLVKGDFLYKYSDTPRGWGNGYVDVPSWHPLFGMSYDDVYDGGYDISVDGGLTFSENIKKDPSTGKHTATRFGFDTAHSHNSEHDDLAYVEQETLNLREQLWDIYVNSTNEIV